MLYHLLEAANSITAGKSYFSIYNQKIHHLDFLFHVQLYCNWFKYQMKQYRKMWNVSALNKHLAKNLITCAFFALLQFLTSKL